MGACAQCGATFADATQNCEERFDTLLALDHSRVQPWGSRHGLAFSTFALQHPEGRTEAQPPFEWGVPPLPEVPPAGTSYTVTIADLGGFDAETYPEKLEEWGRATLAVWMAST
jgi:hypothetical protein